MNTQKQNYFICAHAIDKYYNSGHNETLHVLRNLNFEANKGDFIIITGESGSGKSTFLHLLGGLSHPNRGTIKIDTHNINKLNENKLSKLRQNYIGFIFQFHHLLPDFTALENVMLPYLNLSFNKKKATQLAMQLLHDVSMEHRSHHKPKELSGGEQQRIAIARALINKPSIVLADEPTGNLDEHNSTKIQELFFKLHQQYSITLIIATHNIIIHTNNITKNLRLSQGTIQQLASISE